MTGWKPLLRKTGLDVLYFSGANRLLRPFAEGIGAVLMLHRVKPSRSEAFQPNRFLEITPEFLEQTIKWLARKSYQFVSLDEARARLLERRFDARFVAITFDDGFRDNKVWAQPILAKYGVPYTVFVPTDFAEGVGNLWWLALEAIIASHDQIEVDDRAFACKTTREKINAFVALKGMVLSEPTHSDEQTFVRRLARRYRYDLVAATRSVCMNWGEIRKLNADPLVTIGAHTVSHPIMAKAPELVVRAELAESRGILERKLQRDVRHLAYPYGSDDAAGTREFRIASEVGYQTAVTTRTGVLMPGDACRLMQLPRITIDGTYQRERHLDVLVSGVAPAAWNRLRRMLRPNSDRPAWA
jgi:peptidoglycan/xylan/chitin deacetylase (PgdA/CDA1 family)